MAVDRAEGPIVPDGVNRGQGPGIPDVTTAELVNPGHLPGNLSIDMVELGKGCAGDCLSCGAFEKISPEDRMVRPISIEQLEANITQTITDQITGTKYRLVDLFRNYVTSGVDMEPLSSGIFNEAAELIDRLSDGRSKIVAISHGLSCHEKVVDGESRFIMPPAQLEKLQELNDLMLKDVVPLFVLSMDSARSGGIPGQTAKKHHDQIREMEEENSPFMNIIGREATADQSKSGIPMFGDNSTQWKARQSKIKRQKMDLVRGKIQSGEDLNRDEDEISRYVVAWDARRKAVIETNARGYAQTLNTLMPSIQAGKNITISLQGDNYKDSLAYHGMARDIQQETLKILRDVYGISTSDLNRLFEDVGVTPPRLYAPVGRAESCLGVKDPNDDCSVIPDKKFIRRYIHNGDPKVTRGRIRPDGTLLVQLNRPRTSYADTVAPKDDNPWAVVDLTGHGVRVVSNSPAEVPLGETSLGRMGASFLDDGDGSDSELG